MHGFGWSWRIFPRNSRRFGFRSVSRGGGGVMAAGCATKPCPAFCPCLRLTRLQSLRGFGLPLFGRGARLGWFFPGISGGLYNLETMPTACGRSRRAGRDPAGSGS